jgi:hypothetical protein
MAGLPKHLSLPDMQPMADQLLAQLLDAEHLERLNRKTSPVFVQHVFVINHC